jgi:charged multivesicular body protein 6
MHPLVFLTSSIRYLYIYTNPNQKEVSDLLAGRLSVQDEEEVEDELAALEAEVVTNQRVQTLPNVADTPVLPAAPEGELPVAGAEPVRQAEERRQALPA